MKKILGILGTITIAGSGMAGLVGNAPAPAKNEINYSQTNNLKNLKREKRQYYTNWGAWTQANAHKGRIKFY